jgi:hypothetical protein
MRNPLFGWNICIKESYGWGWNETATCVGAMDITDSSCSFLRTGGDTYVPSAWAEDALLSCIDIKIQIILESWWSGFALLGRADNQNSGGKVGAGSSDIDNIRVPRRIGGSTFASNWRGCPVPSRIGTLGIERTPPLNRDFQMLGVNSWQVHERSDAVIVLIHRQDRHVWGACWGLFILVGCILIPVVLGVRRPEGRCRPDNERACFLNCFLRMVRVWFSYQSFFMSWMIQICSSANIPTWREEDKLSFWEKKSSRLSSLISRVLRSFGASTFTPRDVSQMRMTVLYYLYTLKSLTC